MGMLARACALAAALAATNAANAQNYPNKPVRVIVPFAAAGPTDIIARLVGQKLAENLGQQFYIENMPGAGGNTGTAMVAKSPHDGYTLLVVSTGFVVNPSLYAKVPYDPVKEFAPITLIAASPNVMVVNPEVPAKSVKELIELIKTNPGKYSYAQPAIGSTPHLSGELFKISFRRRSRRSSPRPMSKRSSPRSASSPSRTRRSSSAFASTPRWTSGARSSAPRT